MINFFDRLYSSIVSKNEFLDKIRFYSALRFLVRSVANAVLPVYFKLTRNNPLYRLEENGKKTDRVIVSLTSFPARIDKVWLVIETIFRQTIKPDKVILYLTQEQFVGKQLPESLERMKNRGLQVEVREPKIKAHSKYFFAMQEFPNDIIVTVDDDIFYSTKLLETLLSGHQKYPNCTIGVICKQLSFRSDVIPYNKWKRLSDQDAEQPSKYVFGLGVGGMLYPPSVLAPEYKNIDVFSKICLQADDVWLYFMTLMGNTHCMKVKFPTINPLPVLIRNDMKLSTKNVDDNLNDLQIEAVRNYCLDELGRDPFEK